MSSAHDGDATTAMFLAALRDLGDHDLTFTQLAAMVYLMQFPSSSVGQVARVLGRSLAATGRMANDLVKAGLVLRTESTSDRRVKPLRLTPSGRRFVERLHQRRMAGVRRSVAARRSQRISG